MNITFSETTEGAVVPKTYIVLYISRDDDKTVNVAVTSNILLLVIVLILFFFR